MQDTEKESTAREEPSTIVSTNTSETMCKGLAENLLTIFNSFKNGGIESDNTKYGRVGRLVTKKLNLMNSFEAARISSKIVEILLLYDSDNPLNPNNYKTECV